MKHDLTAVADGRETAEFDEIRVIFILFLYVIFQKRNMEIVYLLQN